jgi:hypothetical protein
LGAGNAEFEFLIAILVDIVCRVRWYCGTYGLPPRMRAH